MSETQSGDDLLSRLAGMLGGRVQPSGESLAAPELDRRALILRLARDVAHATERQNAPLATYLVGRYVELRRSAGGTESQALAEAASIIDALAGSPSGEAPSDPWAH